MKRFNAWLTSHTKHPGIAASFEAIADLISLEPHGDLVAARPLCNRSNIWLYAPRGVQPEMWAGIATAAFNDRSSTFESWALGGMTRDGVKVFAPDADQFNALSRVELNVPGTEYRQPFSTFVVAIPDEVYSSPVSEDHGTPAACVVRTSPVGDGSLVVLSVLGTGRATLTSQFHFVPGGKTIEEAIGATSFDDDAVFTDSESQALDRITRAALNACLLLTNAGFKNLGSANPDFERRLVAGLKKKNLSERARSASQIALKNLPQMFGFNQHVRVFETATQSTGELHDGYEVKAHWRRGHWAHQPHGTGRKERKLIFRPAVLVNPHLLAGPLSNTRVTLTVPPRATATSGGPS